MDILVQVKEGRIEVVQARGEKPWTFHRVDEAAAYVAERVAATAAPVNFHHSCSYPADHGLPSFSKPAFVEDIQDRIYVIQSQSRAKAA